MKSSQLILWFVALFVMSTESQARNASIYNQCIEDSISYFDATFDEAHFFCNRLVRGVHRSRGDVQRPEVAKKQCLSEYGTTKCGYNCTAEYGQIVCSQKPDQMCIAEYGKIRCGYNCIAEYGNIRCAKSPHEICVAEYGRITCSDDT